MADTGDVANSEDLVLPTPSRLDWSRFRALDAPD